MTFLIGFLTVLLVLVSVLLILLVLIQLPKKEAGAGLAFGGAATDALFGAGTGNALTKITKYATGAFFVLAIAVAALQSHYYHRAGSEFQRAIQQESSKAMQQENNKAGNLEPLPAGTPVAPATAPATTNPAAASQ